MKSCKARAKEDCIHLSLSQVNCILYFLRIDKKLIINSGGKGTLLFLSCNLLLTLNHMKDNPAMSIEEPEDSDNINSFILYYGNFFH